MCVVQLSLFESEAPHFDSKKTRKHGKIFTLTRDKNKSGNIDINDLEWKYLKGDGDFRSSEVCALRDEADIIITNPPGILSNTGTKFIIQLMVIAVSTQSAVARLFLDGGTTIAINIP